MVKMNYDSSAAQNNFLFPAGTFDVEFIKSSLKQTGQVMSLAFEVGLTSLKNGERSQREIVIYGLGEMDAKQYSMGHQQIKEMFLACGLAEPTPNTDSDDLNGRRARVTCTHEWSKPKNASASPKEYAKLTWSPAATSQQPGYQQQPQQQPGYQQQPQQQPGHQQQPQQQSGYQHEYGAHQGNAPVDDDEIPF